jgi:methylmalonyl-CoA/ethylmalonyl-CoA epimerase
MTPEALGLSLDQVAVIVKDLDASLDRYRTTLGWEPWTVYLYEAPDLHDLTVAGEPASFTWIGAEIDLGNTGFELLQPLEPKGVFYEWLAAHGEGVHHLGHSAANVEEAQELRKRLLAQGARDLLSAWISDVYFFYVETELGIIEVWAGDMASQRPLRMYP